jgi:plasmid rolling circle replication initiator protein Rep
MTWAIALLACTSSGTYNEVAKLMMLPHINAIYRKRAEIITTNNDNAYCLHMHMI